MKHHAEMLSDFVRADLQRGPPKDPCLVYLQVTPLSLWLLLQQQDPSSFGRIIIPYSPIEGF